MEADKHITTGTGILFSYHNPTTEMIELEDIAQGLSSIKRFLGHSNRTITVAEHSVLVVHEMICRSKRAALLPEVLLSGLFHDAPEAYMGDCPGPLKRIIGLPWTRVEERIAGRVHQKFGLKWPLTLLDIRLIKAADVACYGSEMEWADKLTSCSTKLSPSVMITGLTRVDAKAAFIYTFTKLMSLYVKQQQRESGRHG